VFYFFGILFVDWLFFGFHPSTFGLLGLAIVIFKKQLLPMRFSQPHNLGWEFVMLAQVDSRCFIIIFFQYCPLR